MQITKDEAQKTAIIIPSNPTPREAFSAAELQKYLRKLLALETAILSDTEEWNGQRFILGGPERNRAAAGCIGAEDFKQEVPGPEGIYIESFGSDTLLLAGSSGDFERGTVYALYEFLERFCGCSLSAYTHPDAVGGEYVPHLEKLCLEGVSYRKACADTPYRTAIVQYGDAAGKVSHGLNVPFLDWLAKNRYNRILTWSAVYEDLKKSGLLEEAVRRGINFTVGHHGASRHFMPPYGNEYFPEHYYETHPEYYKLKPDGTRFCITDHWGQCVFCSRNEAMYEVLTQNIIQWIKENPLVDTIAFWPQDGMDEDCVCEKCREHSKLENYTYFMNELAKRVGAVCPHVKIDMLLYVDLWECPEGIPLSCNLFVDEGAWHESGLRRVGNADGSGLAGSLFEENILKWRAAGAQTVYYDYFMGVYPARNRYIPMADEVQSMVKRFREVGISGSGTQIECFNMWNHIFNFYVFARTAYDSELTMEDNLSRFCRIFGGGAEYVKEIIRLSEDCVNGQATVDQAGWYLMEHVDKERIYRLFDEALTAAETALSRNNVRLMRMAFRYSDLETAQEGAKEQYPYQAVKEYSNISPELLYMTKFDSFRHNDPGYGIMIPVTGEANGTFEADEWYGFE